MVFGSRAQNEHPDVHPPSWAHFAVATVGVALLIGPMLAVLWPR